MVIQLIIILIVLIALIALIVVGHGKENIIKGGRPLKGNKIDKGNKGNKVNEDDFLTLNKSLTHIKNLPKFILDNKNNDLVSNDLVSNNLVSNDFQIIKNINSNLLPSSVKDKFWAFYPLIHFQSFIFKFYLQLNDNHIKSINDNSQFKVLIDYLLNLDLFLKPSLNVGLFLSYDHFLLPKLRYLQIGDKNNDFELLKLYRQRHIHIKDSFIYDIVIKDYKEYFTKNELIYDILYFQPEYQPDATNNKHKQKQKENQKHKHKQKENQSLYVLLLTIANFSLLISENSLVIIEIIDISQFIVDIVTILQYIFEDVHIVRSIMDLAIYQTKHIICKKLNKMNLKNIVSKILYIATQIHKSSKVPIKIFIENIDTKLISIHDQLENDRIKHIYDCVKIMDIIYSVKKNIINFENLKNIQDAEKLKAINLFSKLGIKPNYTILFSKKDVQQFLFHDKPLIILFKHANKEHESKEHESKEHANKEHESEEHANKEHANKEPESEEKMANLLNKFKILETELFLHKSYLNRVEWKKFKYLDKLFRLTSTLKMIIKKRKMIGNSHHLSQAFFKMLEVLNECFTKKDFNGAQIAAFHICEAPGQFIKSFQTYSKLQHLKYTWKAQTLRPDNKNYALDDVYGLISNNKHNWLYGKDNTGDITSHSNILEYEQLSKKYKYNIITSDCGIQFSSYEFQEEEIEFINYSQFLTMMLCLQNGGHCVMKIFLPLVRPIALYMHNMLFEYFNDIIYFKPSLNLTSSEIYLVGKNYKGISHLIRNELLQIHKNFKSFDFKSFDFNHKKIKLFDFNHKNLEKHYNACNKLVFNSISCINKYLFFYYYMDSNMEKKIKNNLYHESNMWINKYF
jgi:hypothetical protein